MTQPGGKSPAVRNSLFVLAGLTSLVFGQGLETTEDLSSTLWRASETRILHAHRAEASPVDLQAEKRHSIDHGAGAEDGIGPIRNRVSSLRRRAEGLRRQGQLQKALQELEMALALAGPDSEELPPTLNDLGDILFRRGELHHQENVLRRALGQAVSQGDLRSAASSWNGLGRSFAARGRPSAALDAYHRSLELLQDLDDRHATTMVRHDLGVQMLLLGHVEAGVEELRQAATALRQLGRPVGEGQALASLAWGLGLSNRSEEALATYAEALPLLESAKAVHELVRALELRARLYSTLGLFAAASKDLERSLDLLGKSGDAPGLRTAYLQLALASVQRRLCEPGARGQLAELLASLRRSAEDFDAFGAQEGRIHARLELARALRTVDGGRDEAIFQLEAAIEIIEAARSDLRLPSFRAGFLAGWHEVYRELADILASAALESAHGDPRSDGPAGGPGVLAARALAVAERARARSLLDRMASADAVPRGPSPGSMPWLGLRERVEELEIQTLIYAAEASERPTGARGASPETEETRAALLRARFALEQAQEVARRRAPRKPAATPAGIDSILRHLDPDTALLVYSLAPERSWLWHVEAREVKVHPLPPGPQIEAAARRAYRLLPLHHRRGYGSAAQEALALLARLVLAPLGGDLGPGRLAVVSDGALNLVPFGALPMTPDEGPIAERYEVVHLPSASTLVELRRRAGRSPATRLLALVADPVFEPADSRLTGQGEPASPESRSTAGAAPRRRARKGPLDRLPASAAEVSSIAEIARRSLGSTPEIHRGLDARRELVTTGGLRDFQILHFATHGLVDRQDPSIAGLVLSLIDEDGQPTDGLLRPRDLYDLRLSADLVVLSACRSAVGKEIRGEGLVGLTHGFLGAGANQVVVSLWEVEDRATAELMARFYHHLFLERRSPAGALHHAQLELRTQTPWRSPAHWAAFIAVGDWQAENLPPLSVGTRRE